MSLSEISVRRPVATTMFFLAVIMLGVVSLSRLPVDLLPDVSYPKLTIWTSYPNVPPVEVEGLITVPIEEAVSSVPRIRRVASVSKEGVSLVTLEFLWGTNMDIAALNLREKLDNLRWTLPQEAERPTILRLDPRALPVMSLAVTGGDLVPLKEFTRNVIKRRLEQIQGVALAAVTGGLEREIQVEVDSRKLTALGVSIEEVGTALANANRSLPGGTIKKGLYRYALRTIGEFQDTQELQEVVVANNGNSAVIALKDIAKVVDGFRERESITRFNGQETIGVVITKEAAANAVEVSRRVLEVVEQLRREYLEVSVAVAANQAEFISAAIGNVEQAVSVGAVLAFVVLFLFLRDVRHPINIGLVIPISILAAFTIMFFGGISLNMISLSGLALGVGMLVDNSIVVLENIFRLREEGADMRSAAIAGAREVATPITAATLTTIAVFFPIIYVQGFAGQLFRDQYLTVTFALLASLAVSLTLLPMLAAHFFRQKERGEIKTAPEIRIYSSLFERRASCASLLFQRILQFIVRPFVKFWKWLGSWLQALVRFWLEGLAKVLGRVWRPLLQTFDRVFNLFSQKYEILLGWALRNRAKVIMITGISLIVSGLLSLVIDRQLMPKVDQKEFLIKVEMPPGSSLESVSQVVGEMESILLSRSEVASVFSNIGLASDQSGLLLEEAALHWARLLVRLHPRSPNSSDEIMASLRPEFERIPAAKITLAASENLLSQYLGAAEADVAIKISGSDLGLMNGLLHQVEERVRKVPGLVDLRSSYEEGRPEIRITIDREAAGRYGLSARQVADFVQNHMRGTVATQFTDFDRKIDIVVRPEVSARDELADLLNAQIRVGNHSVPLRELIRAEQSRGPTEIHRENQVRQVALYGNVSGRGYSSVVQDIERRIAEIERPYDHQIAVGGAREEMRRSFRSLTLAILLAAALVYMILAAEFESLVFPFIIIVTIPLAAIGAVLSLFVTGQSFNVMSLIGVVVLVGIVDNDAVIKVDFINQERRRGASVHDAIIAAGQKRLRPILMTTFTTVLGLLPLALGFGPGGELQRPLAVAISGGLLSATFLTLVVVPVVYSLVVGRKNITAKG